MQLEPKIIYDAKPQAEPQPLGFLDVEYLRAVINDDAKKMRRLRRAGAKVKIGRGYFRYSNEFNIHTDYFGPNAEQDYLAACKKERRESRKEFARVMLDDGFWCPNPKKHMAE